MDDLSGYGYCGKCHAIHERDQDGYVCDSPRLPPKASVVGTWSVWSPAVIALLATLAWITVSLSMGCNGRGPSCPPPKAPAIDASPDRAANACTPVRR